MRAGQSELEASWKARLGDAENPVTQIQAREWFLITHLIRVAFLVLLCRLLGPTCMGFLSSGRPRWPSPGVPWRGPRLGQRRDRGRGSALHPALPSLNLTSQRPMQWIAFMLFLGKRGLFIKAVPRSWKAYNSRSVLWSSSVERAGQSALGYLISFFSPRWQ